MTAAAALMPTSAELLSAVLCAVRRHTPGRLARVTDDERYAWAMLDGALQAALLLARVEYVSPLGPLPRDLRAAHALWSEAREAVGAGLDRELRGHLRARSPLAKPMDCARASWRATARTVDELFEGLTEGRF